MQVVSAIVQFPKPVAGVYTLMLGNRVAGFKLQITSYGADGKTNGHYITSPETASFPPPFYQFELPLASGADIRVEAASKISTKQPSR
jgi:hypothetical protein